MTGRLDSTVSAYLLKKQGHRVLGISVMWTEGDLEKDLFSPWDLPDINGVKDICEHLDIPFYGVHGHDLFQANVAERLISARLSGEVFCFQSHMHMALIDVLIDKAEKLNADGIATGHYAKTTRNQTTGQYSLSMASDSKNDQSFMLAQLNQRQMEKLSFPLAEVRLEQVKKIEALFNFNLFPPKKRPLQLNSEKLVSYIEQNSADIFYKEGLVLNFREGHTLGDHEGVHHYRLGQNKVVLKGGIPIDSNLKIISIDAYKGNIFVDQPSELSVDTVVLTELKIDAKWDVSKPMVVFVQAGAESERCPAMMLLKNNKLAVLTYKDAFKDMIPLGEQLVIYERAGARAKVVASARVLKSGLMTDKGIEVIPKSLDDDDDDEKDEKKKNESNIQRNDYGF